MTSLQPFKDNISLEKPEIFSNLVLFPIISNQPQNGFELKTLEEGMREIRLRVNETNLGGHRSIRITNSYPNTDAFIIDGEGITGGYQNRISESSIIIQSGTSRVVPVFCSERGRWAGPGGFDTANSIAYPTIRKINTGSSVIPSAPRDSQHSIWSEIHRKQKSLKVVSHNESMQDIYIEKEDELDRFKHIKPKENQIGFMAATQRRFLCIDFFYNNALFGKFHMKLLISYALDIIEDEISGSGHFRTRMWEEFFHDIFSASSIFKKKSSNEHIYHMKEGVGKVLFYKGHLIHASFYHDKSIK